MSKIALRWVCVAAIVLITLWCITQTVMALVQCIPIQAVWDHSIDGKCIPNQPTLWYIHGIIHVISDFIIILMPLRVICRVQIHDTSGLSVVETGVARGAKRSVHSCTDRYVILNPPEVLV
jgi:hypothetical protein